MVNREDVSLISFMMPDGTVVGMHGIDQVPQIGSGVFSEGVFYRVTDVWWNCAEETPHNWFGWNVKLELAGEGDHPLRDFDPAYYG